MNFLSNMHTHTSYSDGTGSPEDYIKAALAKSFVSIGFSDHAYAPYDPDCCMKRQSLSLYCNEITQLKKKYAGQIEVYLGLESDFYCPADKSALDFVIGAVHYIRVPHTGEYITVDYLHEDFQKAIDQMGGVCQVVHAYYSLIGEMAEQHRPDILAHMDLVTKLNSGDRYFDTSSDWYRQVVGETIERIATTECIVEVNTGAVSRGYTKLPYPEPFILNMLRAKKIPVTVSSDCHKAEMLDNHFGLALTLIKQAGYSCVRQMRGGSFVDVEL